MDTLGGSVGRKMSAPAAAGISELLLEISFLGELAVGIFVAYKFGADD